MPISSRILPLVVFYGGLLPLAWPLLWHYTAHPFRLGVILLVASWFTWRSDSIPLVLSWHKLIVALFLISCYLLLWWQFATISYLLLLASLLCWVYAWGKDYCYASLDSMAMLVLLLPTIKGAPSLLTPLQHFHTYLAGYSLKLLGVTVEITPFTLHLPRVTILINDQCAGLGFLGKLILLALCLSFLSKLTAKQRWQLLILAIFLALLSNALRIISLALVSLYLENLKELPRWDVLLGACYFIMAGALLAIVAHFYRLSTTEISCNER